MFHSHVNIFLSLCLPLSFSGGDVTCCRSLEVRARAPEFAGASAAALREAGTTGVTAGVRG